MVTTIEMRKKVADQYGPEWARKVAQMPDSQVYALYMRIVRDGRLSR